jgi:hypothetical protein
MADERCGTCRFWVAKAASRFWVAKAANTKPGARGECHWWPPQHVGSKWTFPPTTAQMWCAQYEQRPTIETQEESDVAGKAFADLKASLKMHRERM